MPKGAEPASYSRRLAASVRSAVPVASDLAACLSLPHLHKIADRNSARTVSKIQDLSTHSTQIRSILYDLLVPHEYPADDKTALVTGSVALALEHQEAIVLLIKSKMFGSAFALVRSVVDTMSRALWLNARGTDEHIERAVEDEISFPKMPARLDEIKQSFFPEGEQEAADEAELVANGFQRLKEAWPALCDYTHTSERQVARRFINGDLKPNYPEEDIVGMLDLTNEAVLLFVFLFFRSMGQLPEAAVTVKLLRDYRGMWKRVP